MSQPHFANFIIKRPWLNRMFKPISEWYCNAAGYRQLGLRMDDLIPEESETIQKALKRLPPKEAYDRVFRIRRAFQCSLAHQLLPRDQWTKPDEDTMYLTPYIEEVESENRERDDLQAMTIIRKEKPSPTL